MQISLKKQKILAYIPFINFSLFIIVKINSKYMDKHWRTSILKYMFLTVALFIPLLLLKDIVTPYIGEKISNFMLYYISSVIMSNNLIIFQKKNGIH